MTAWYAYPISHGYYSAYNPNVWDTPHFAVDIATPFHTPITAIKSGTVEQADYAPWGGEVFIRPDDGSTEYYYYHFDVNEVSKGQHVSAGQEVGLSGGQTSGGVHPVTDGESTGAHTHVGQFTGYVNTPIGTRPTGPDISGIINYLKTGGNYESNTTPTQQVTSNANAVQIAKSGLTKVGIFFVALVLIGGGAYLLFQKQINSAVKKGVDVAKVALV